jgi:hypothetical protein
LRERWWCHNVLSEIKLGSFVIAKSRLMMDIFFKIPFGIVWRLRFDQGLEKGHLYILGMLSNLLL